MRGLVLAEKPSMMRAIQAAYQSDKFPFQLDFAAFHGHLMGLANPGEYTPAWEKWDVATLPMIPDRFKYLPRDGESVKKICSRIRAGKYDFIVNACDAGREGEHIFWSFYEANGLTEPVKRLWSSTTEEEDLRDALHDLRPADEFKNLRSAAKFRAELDWLTGMNFSRAVGLQTNSRANLGRVMTPTLKMVVDREKEIENFVPQSFYEVTAKLEKDGAIFPGTMLVPPEKKETRFQKKELAEKAAAAVSGNGVVVHAEKKRKATMAPTLYSTLELQKDASRYYKFRASKTDDLAQELYEAGYISYPRTDCRFLPSSLIPKLPKLLKPLEAFPELTAALKLVTPASIDKATKGKKYVDDGELTDHHAIIPTTACFDPSKLTADQHKLYLLVAKRFLSIFLPPYVVDNTTVLVEDNGQTFKAAGRAIVDRGFSMLYDDKSKDVILPDMKKGDLVKVHKPSIREGKTVPPDRYTDKTLLDAMANAGKFVSAAEQRAILREADGIGTSATRAGILDKLEQVNMLKVEKGYFGPTPFGRALIDALGERDICSPVLTAEWEGRLRELTKNGGDAAFRAKMVEYIRVETADLLANVNTDLSAFRFPVIGTCPVCGSPVVATTNYFRCMKHKADVDPCPLIVSRKETMGVVISEADMKTMLEGKPTKDKTLTSKSGTQYIAPLIITSAGRVAPAIGDNAPKKESVKKEDLKLDKGFCKCPLCAEGHIYKGKNYYLCTHKGDGCTFSLTQTLCGTPITQKEVVALVKGEVVGPKTFTWKSKKQGQAKIVLKPAQENGAKVAKLEFIFG